MSSFPAAGCRHLQVQDPIRSMTFPVFVLYPSEAPAELMNFGPFAMTLAPNAAPAAGRFPLLMFSHGSGSSYLVYRTLALHLAKQGYVVVMPEHAGDNRNDRSLQGTFENLEHRPRQARLAIDAVMNDPGLATHIKAESMAAMGHSLGGYTALVLAGGSAWWGPDRKIQGTRDERIRALVLLAPVTSWFIPPDALKAVDVPILMQTAEHDALTPKWQAQLLLDGVAQPASVKWTPVANAGHWSFLSPFPESMKGPHFHPAMDPEGFDREAFHERLNQEIQDFLRTALP